MIPIPGNGERWVEEAICPTIDAELFFPDKGGSSGPAKQICQRCPVVLECAEYAIRTDQRFGVWGGMSEKQRRAMRRQLRRAA